MRYYGLARKQLQGQLAERLTQKIKVEKGRYLLEHGRRRDAERILRDVAEIKADVEFAQEAVELLAFCTPVGTA